MSSSGTLESHKGLLKFFDDALKSKNKVSATDILIEKAKVLKNLGEFNKAYDTFNKAIRRL